MELCGLKNGEKLSDNRKGQSQNNIAKELGISIAELNRLIAIERKLTPEFKELLDEGIINKTTVYMV